MTATLVIQRTLQFSHKDNVYISEVLTIQADDEPAKTVFSVDIETAEVGIRCTVNHHTPHGVVYHRECTYPEITGPYNPENNDSATLIPEFLYLMHLYLEDGWLASHEEGMYRYGSERTHRQHEHLIIMKKKQAISDIQTILDSANKKTRRNGILDMLGEWTSRYSLEREGYGTRQTENIYVDRRKSPTERYIICVNYAQTMGQQNNAAALAVVLEMLRRNRSDFLAKTARFFPPPIETIFGDGESGEEGIRQYLWHLQEAERKTILGIINLELFGDGDQLVVSNPHPHGNGKLLVALVYKTKSANRHLVKKLPSPLLSVLEADSIPLVTICNLHSEDIGRVVLLANQQETVNKSIATLQKRVSTISESTLENAVELLRDMIQMLTYVKGDEFDGLPDIAYTQPGENLSLISINEQNA